MRLPQEAEWLTEEEVLSSARVSELFPEPEIRSALIQNGVLVPDKEGGLRVHFVGVAVAGARAFQILPKIFPVGASNATATMQQVIRALRRYARWQPPHRAEAPFLDPTANYTGLNALALADWLIRDYFANGVYRRLQDREEIGGPGRVSWRRTIERMAPVLSSGRPVYVDTITRSTAKDRNHFVSRLHRHIVEEAAQGFGYLLGYGPLNLDHEPFEPFGDLPALALCHTKAH